MNAIVQQMIELFEQELFADVARLGELSVSVCEQNPDALNHIQQFKMYLYYADALYCLNQFSSAENAYLIALHLRKQLVKSRKLLENDKEHIGEIDLKFKIHICFTRQKQNTKSIEILQSIPAKLRTPKINAALGNLYKDEGLERPAIACFKEVLRECPLAIGAAENLLRLGVRGMEVNSLILGPTVEYGWISTWLRGLAEMYTRDHKNAIVTFKSLDSEGCLKDNKCVLLNLARCYNYICDNTNAVDTLQRIIRIDPKFVTGRDLFAGLLARSTEDGHQRDLERLIPEYDTCLWSCEHWVALGYSMLLNNKYERATYFAQQALVLNRRNIEALILKACTFMHLNKHQEAAYHFREALQYCPYRFEANEGLVHSYIAMNRFREATTVANSACKQMNNAAPALTLYASVLVKDPMNNAKARGVLEKAIATDPTYLPPVCLLSELLQHERSYVDAVSILKKYLDIHPTSRAHQLLGDCLVRMQKDDEAFISYGIALRMDPQNQRALEGMSNIGRGDPAAYGSQNTTSSDQEADQDSDTDHWPDRVGEVLSFD